MVIPYSDLARITYVEVLTCFIPGDGSSGRNDTRIRLELETKQGPEVVWLSGNQVSVPELLEAQREGRLLSNRSRAEWQYASGAFPTASRDVGPSPA